MNYHGTEWRVRCVSNSMAASFAVRAPKFLFAFCSLPFGTGCRPVKPYNMAPRVRRAHPSGGRILSMGAKKTRAKGSIPGMQAGSRRGASQVEEHKMLILALKIMAGWTGIAIIGSLMLGRLLRKPSPARAHRTHFLMPASASFHLVS